MKRRLHSISIILLVAYLFIMVAGCGGSTNATSTPQKSPAVQQSTVTDNKVKAEVPAAASAQAVPVTATVQPAIQAKTVDPAPVIQNNQQEQTVYITKTGLKYHSAGCRYLSRSQIPISLSDAKSEGYTPCSVCNPPQ
jgi:micrococcal nuclease